MPLFTCRHIKEEMEILTALAEIVPSAPEPYLRQLVKKGKVLISDTAATLSSTVNKDDSITLPNNERLLDLLYESHVEIVFETANYFIVNKPAGLPVHARDDNDKENLKDRLTHLVKRRGELYKIYPAHRLDLGTSGLVIMAKGKSSVNTLGEMLMERTINKEYLAIVTGTLDESGVIDLPVKSHEKMKESKTYYTTLATANGYSFVRVRLDSGRKHQIRVHFNHIGSPLVGDTRYNLKSVNASRMMLHACQLTFKDPFTQEDINIELPLPEEFQEFCKDECPELID